MPAVEKKTKLTKQIENVSALFAGVYYTLQKKALDLSVSKLL